MRGSRHKCVVVELGIVLNVIHDVSNFLVGIVDSSQLLGGLDHWFEFGFFWLSAFQLADSLVHIADNTDSSVSVSAEQGQASGHHNHFIAFDVESPGFLSRNFVDMFGPVLVADSWGAISSDLDVTKDAWLVDINVRDNCQTSSQTDTSDVKGVDTGLPSQFFQVVHDFILNGFPHGVVGFLDFAVGAGSLVDDLNLKILVLEWGRECLARRFGRCWCIWRPAQWNSSIRWWCTWRLSRLIRLDGCELVCLWNRILCIPSWKGRCSRLCRQWESWRELFDPRKELRPRGRRKSLR